MNTLGPRSVGSTASKICGSGIAVTFVLAHSQRRKGRMNVSNIPVNHSFMSMIGPEQAWFAGLIAADGYVQKHKYISLSQSGKNGRKIIRYVCRILSYMEKIRIPDKGEICLRFKSIY